MKFHSSKTEILRDWAGCLAVIFIRLSKMVPISIIRPFFLSLLPLYMLIRIKHIRKVSGSLRSQPNYFSIFKYYFMRIQLLFEAITYSNPKDGLPPHVSVKNPELLDTYLRQKKPVLLCGIHLGAFEMCHWAPYFQVARTNRKMTLLTAPSFSKKLDKLMHNWRAAPRKKIVQREGKELKGEIRHTIRSGGLMAIMVDQSPYRSENHITLWKMLTIPYTDKILKVFINNSALVMGITSVFKKGKVMVEYHEIGREDWGKPFNADSWKSEITRFIQTNVSKAPEQWNWSYPGISTVV